MLGLLSCARPGLPPQFAVANNRVEWSSDAVALAADDFSIEAGGKRYLGNVAQVDVRSDPGTPEYRTLEVTWWEQGAEMRLSLYFRADARHWWVDEIRTYNGQTPGDWIIYKGIFFKSPLNTAFSGNLDLAGTSEDQRLPIPGKLHFRNVTITPKPLAAVRPNDEGPVHVLLPLTGTILQAGQPVTVQARIDVPYPVAAIDITLWDVASGFRRSWNFPAPADAKPLDLRQMLEVPARAPAGDDYRLELTARPPAGTTGAIGYSLRVKVGQAP